MNLEEAMENIYTSLQRDNEDIDLHIANLKAALATTGNNSITVDPQRLPYNNRQGKKMMQSYFRKSGINVSFAA